MNNDIAGWIATGCEVMADLDEPLTRQDEIAVEIHDFITRHGIERVLSALADGAESAADVQETTLSGKLVRKQLLDVVHALRVES